MTGETKLTAARCHEIAVTENGLAFKAEPGSAERAAHDERREIATLAARAKHLEAWLEKQRTDARTERHHTDSSLRDRVCMERANTCSDALSILRGSTP